MSSFTQQGWAFTFLILGAVYCLAYRRHLNFIAENWLPEHVPFHADEVDAAPKGGIILAATLAGLAVYVANDMAAGASIFVGVLCLIYWVAAFVKAATREPEAHLKSWHYWRVARKATGHGAYVLLAAGFMLAQLQYDPDAIDTAITSVSSESPRFSDWARATPESKFAYAETRVWAMVDRPEVDKAAVQDALNEMARNLVVCLNKQDENSSMNVNEAAATCFMLMYARK